MPIQATAVAPLTNQDRTTIRNGIAKFDKDVLAGNWAAVAAAYTEDAVLLPPHASMVRGRKAIQQFFQEFPKFTKFTENPLEVEGEGDFAFPWGTYETSDAAGVKDRGKVLAVWHKEHDGTWLVSRVCWNSDLEPAA
jgi:ketosteroid isomerase-like protein